MLNNHLHASLASIIRTKLDSTALETVRLFLIFNILKPQRPTYKDQYFITPGIAFKSINHLPRKIFSF